jgi:dTDP-4-dehydrorhamnose 3,5-epimerase
MVQHLNNDILLTPLKIIPNDKGDILHALKATDETYMGFGEAYFSTINEARFKGWKRHFEMTLNLIVPVGAIKFYIVDERGPLFVQNVVLSKDHYYRLTIPPGVWLGFEGVGKGANILLNIASIPHDPNESENRVPNFFAHFFTNFNEDHFQSYL